MKFKKLILPMMAFIFAIGLAFANVDMKTEPVVETQDYVFINGSWEGIPEQNCAQGSATCRVQFGQGGPIYDVYDEMNLSTLKNSNTTKPTVLNP
ncbi:hypothetical protein SAMN04487764_0237 [Gillisia sp. Hel1_33_143]|uniref:DUF6520 family protein n=1 Tax=Gillisia sp. Hel1_33_143 TaxID=1336796 RepID=UPI00087B4728|nr:DUF6520 family protein [Gillisia sp. Hel1_33_143]SDR68399.1 hypothetical protein SAMN04487764_0237 [Gillisia sp. Hel1_33_143]